MSYFSENCFFHKPRINVIIAKLQNFTYMLLTYYCRRVCAEYTVIILAMKMSQVTEKSTRQSMSEHLTAQTPKG